jgi:hypothetical protein
MQSGMKLNIARVWSTSETARNVCLVLIVVGCWSGVLDSSFTGGGGNTSTAFF